MFFETGLFGTRAPFYLDLVGIYFFALPILLFISITWARQKKIELHIKSQLAIFIMTLVMVVVFEVGMRLAGGFSEYMKQSSVPRTFFITFLVVHIIIAVATVNLWSYQIIASMRMYKRGELHGENVKRHKKIALFLLSGIAVTLVQGISIYFFLFVM